MMAALPTHDYQRRQTRAPTACSGMLKGSTGRPDLECKTASVQVERRPHPVVAQSHVAPPTAER